MDRLIHCSSWSVGIVPACLLKHAFSALPFYQKCFFCAVCPQLRGTTSASLVLRKLCAHHVSSPTLDIFRFAATMGGGKKRKQILETPEELVNRPWCYYCNRGFDNLNTLCDHQKKVHMRCELCRKMMTTIGGLKVHLSQVHKETLTEVPNHVEGRNDLVSEVFGMYGIPADVMEQHKERVYAAYNKEQAEYRKKTGNPLPGTSHHKEVMAMMQTQQANKKQKVEDDINAAKARVAELKARKLAEKLAAKQAATPPDINSEFFHPFFPIPVLPAT